MNTYKHIPIAFSLSILFFYPLHAMQSYMPPSTQGKIVLGGVVVIGAGVVVGGIYYLSKGNRGLPPQIKSEMNAQTKQTMKDLNTTVERLSTENKHLTEENESLKKFKQQVNPNNIPEDQMSDNVLHYGPFGRRIAQTMFNYMFDTFTIETKESYNRRTVQEKLVQTQVWILEMLSKMKREQYTKKNNA
ncbi:MAG TPA: hypothetical protein VGW78_04015 [Candidatus Babeliales bacterium]|jgi:hypothetical protein|nr:hypothetical protein [Candidatus Babeliales bacterium]